MTEKEQANIVCLVGSTRFRAEYDAANRDLTLKGHIVLTCGVWVHHEAEEANTPEVKERLDKLHRQKIDLADEVFVVNPDGYTGESTRAEIEYARRQGKPVGSLEPLGIPGGGAAVETQ